MSTNVAVICEDHTLDQYIAVPVVRAALAELGRRRASVSAVTNPRLRGVEDMERQFASLALRYTQINDAVVFVADLDKRDGQEGRPNRIARFANLLTALEPEVQSRVAVVLARQETEVWAMWGSRQSLSDSWTVVRAERDSKDVYFPQIQTREDLAQPGRGRSRLIESSLGSWTSLAQGCPELSDLQTDLGRLLL